MKVLFLGNAQYPLLDFVRQTDEAVGIGYELTSEVDIHGIDFIVSYGYRYKIPKWVIESLPGRVINLHISYLPYNRGADPNFWSFIDDIPKGVTIHQVSVGIDEGDILVQEIVNVSEYDTFRFTYTQLHMAIQSLFKANWHKIKNGKITPVKQIGSYHCSADKDKYIRGIEDKWMDLVICEVLDCVAEIQMSEQFIQKECTESET